MVSSSHREKERVGANGKTQIHRVLRLLVLRNCFSISNWRRSVLWRKSCRSRYPSFPRLWVFISSSMFSCFLKLSQSNFDFSNVLILAFFPICPKTEEIPPNPTRLAPPLPLPRPLPTDDADSGDCFTEFSAVESDNLASAESIATSFSIFTSSPANSKTFVTFTFSCTFGFCIDTDLSLIGFCGFGFGFDTTAIKS